MASIAASSTFHSFCRTKTPNLSSTHLLPLSKNLNFRTRAIGNSRNCSFAGFIKQNRLGLRKLSSIGEGGEGVAVAEEQPQETVSVAEEQPQETVSVPVSPSDMLTMFFQVHHSLSSEFV